jgi:hypothetical protein
MTDYYDCSTEIGLRLPRTYFDAPGANMVRHLFSLRPFERRAYGPGIQSAEKAPISIVCD